MQNEPKNQEGFEEIFAHLFAKPLINLTLHALSPPSADPHFRVIYLYFLKTFGKKDSFL
jgi:hypothetical protein